MEIIKKSKNHIKKIITALKNGAVIVCPTDTVYGLVCDATNKKAVEKIYKIKKRPKSKPLPVFVKDIQMAKELAEIDKEPASASTSAKAMADKEAMAGRQEKILKKYWPGKFTLVFKIKPCEVGPRTKLYGVDKKTIALRIPKYKFLNDLLKKINKPLAQTSANISNYPATTRLKEVLEQFKNQKNQPDLIIDAGNLKKNKPSVIIDLTKDNIKILRK